MKLVLIGILLTLVTVRMHPVRQDIVALANAPDNTWRAIDVDDNKFAHWPEEKLRGLCGTKTDGGVVQSSPSEGVVGATAGCTVSSTVATANVTGITDFDARNKWPGMIHPIRNQGNCGSCWAYGAASAFTDRRHIFSNEDKLLSPQFLIDCDLNNYGCNGGYLSYVWDFINSTGVPTESCQPETSRYTGLENACSDSSCTGTSGESFQLYHSSGACGGSTMTVDQIKYEMINNGPVEMSFSVYEDFYSYSSGVYQYTSGAYVGGHAIKCFGWGRLTSGSGRKQKITDYWMCANSWGLGWGMQGYFNIKMGDSGINSGVWFANAL